LEEGSHGEDEICPLFRVLSFEIRLSDYRRVSLIPIATNTFAQLAGMQVKRSDDSHLLHYLITQTTNLFLQAALTLLGALAGCLFFGERGESTHADAFVIDLLHQY
jgi:hypothetical protein